MNDTERLIILGVSCYVAYLIGKSRAAAAVVAAEQSPEVSPWESSTAWFAGWGGVK